MPFLGWPVVGPIFAYFVEWIAGKFFTEAAEDTEMYAIAVRNVVDRVAFDQEFIRLSVIQKANPTEKEKQDELAKARAAMARFLRTK